MYEKPQIAPSFESSHELRKAWIGNQESAGKGTYARADYEALRNREKEIAEMIGVPDTALFNAGMAAIATVIEASELRPGDVILAGKDMYGKTIELAKSLSRRGIKVIPIDSGDIEAMADLIEARKPRLILLEAVANDSKMQVCDIAKLAELAEKANKKYEKEYSLSVQFEKHLSHGDQKAFDPEEKKKFLKKIEEFKKGSNPMVFRSSVKYMETSLGMTRQQAVRELGRIVKGMLRSERSSLDLVIDNTLSSPILRNPLQEAEGKDVNIVVVESGTKHFQAGRDDITLGLAYANRPEVLNRIKQKRAAMGTYLQPNDEQMLPEDLISAAEQVVSLQASHALSLAKHLEGIPGILEVMHPNLPSHEHSDLAEALAPGGLVTLFNIRVEDPMAFVDAVKAKAGDAVEIGHSFGHEKTRLLPAPNKGTVRIAAGAETPEVFERIVSAFSN